MKPFQIKLGWLFRSGGLLVAHRIFEVTPIDAFMQPVVTSFGIIATLWI